MLSVFIIGAGGTGKTTLIDEYVTQSGSKAIIVKELARKYMDENNLHQKDLTNEDTFWKLQLDIISLQLQREKELEGVTSYISDRSAIDALVYAAQTKNHLFPLLTDAEEIRQDNITNPHLKLFAPLLDDGGALWQDKANEMLQRYRTSLVVLVNPFSESAEDDGVRKVMNTDEMRDYTSFCRSVLHLLGIPFLDLRETELSARVRMLHRAIRDGIVPSPLETLEHYANITSKKMDKLAAVRHYQEVNFPFYMVKRNDGLRCLSLSGSELRQSLVTSQPDRTSRFLQRYGTERLFVLEFEQEVPSMVVCKLLEHALKVQGNPHSFLGCSASGLKKRKCYLWKGTALEAEMIRQECGHFSRIMSVSKRIARFSLLLSNVVPTDVTPSNIIDEPDVEKDKGANFTDGCGCLSSDLAESLFHQTRFALKWPSDQVDRHPSAFQVRFQGYKGVLTVNSQLSHSTIVVRPSMEKFATDRFPNIYVCDYSRPFSFGHLNRQYIVLLSGLGVPDRVFENLQTEHFDRVRRMIYDPDAALMLLEWRNRASELIGASEAGESDTPKKSQTQDSLAPPFLHLRPLQQRLITESPKLRILVPKSRTLFGVAEPPRFSPRTGNRLPGVLRSGECFVRLSMHGNLPKSLQLRVVVSKNPCYLLGDVRVLQAVSEEKRPALREISQDLVDVIVFPIEGTRPHCEEIAGSDLDGDQYFVCWDNRLIPPRVSAPYSYPAYKSSKVTSRKETSQSGNSKRAAEQEAAALVKYFSIQQTVSRNTGRVDALFRAWSNLKGASCPECERLGQLFSRVVDSAKSGETISVPKVLAMPRDQRPVATAQSTYVWQRMEFAAQVFVAEQQDCQLSRGTVVTWARERIATVDVAHEESDGEASLDDGDADSFLLDLVSRNHLVMSEFTKFRLVMEHLKEDVGSFFSSAFSRHVNFGLLSAAERGFIVDRYGVPLSLVDNALRCYSQIIGFRPKFLQKFLLHGKVPWTFYWHTDKDTGIVAFPTILAHALRNNTDVLLLVQVPDSVVIILRFSRSTMKRDESDALFQLDGLDNCCVGTSLPDFIAIHAYFVSGNFGYHEKYSLEDPSYKIDLSGDGLQLYRGEHGQTFVNLKVASLVGGRKGNQSRKSKKVDKGESLSMTDSVPVLQISVDLTRFNRRILTGNRPHPLVRKTPIYEMEVFVYNRRTNFNELPSRRVTYLDILNEDNQESFQPVCFEQDDTLEDEDSVLDLLPTADDLMEMCHSQLLDNDESHPKEWASCFMSLLHSAQCRFGLFDCIPAGFRELVGSLTEKMMVDIMPFLEDRVTILVELVALLEELGIESGAPLIQPDVPPISDEDIETQLSSFVQLVRRWDLWLTMADPERRTLVLSWLIAGVDETVLNPRLAFIFRNACEQATVLLSELRDGHGDKRSSAAVSQLGNLRLDPTQPFWVDEDTNECDESDGIERGGESHSMRPKKKKNRPLVTLYRVQAIPMGIRFAIGEYVCISRQAAGVKAASLEKQATGASDDVSSTSYNGWVGPQYEVDFPPLSADVAPPTEVTIGVNEFASKRVSFFLARVVSLCEAPFSMTVKLVAPSLGDKAVPELLSQCLERGKQIYWQVTMVPANVVTHVRVIDAIEAFLPSSTNRKLCVTPEILPRLFPVALSPMEEQMPLFSQEPLSANELDNLNDKQAEAVCCSLRYRSSLIHGPPGTGKTTTAVQIMTQILKHSDSRVLVCAETNLAVDNLASRFLRECSEHHGAIRVGGRNVGKRESVLEDINLETLIRKEVKPGQVFFLSRHKKVIDALFERSRIVFTTCAGAGDPLLDGQQFHSVLMDEASMSTEPGALCPLTHGCRHFVLIGDHKQLRPHANGGACISLFERLAQPSPSIKTCMTLLNEQHRMHPALCSFPSRSFYDGQLLTAAGISAARKIPRAFFGGRDAVRFVSVPDGREERVGSGSWFNEVEIQRVLSLLQELLGVDESFLDDSLTAAQITVLTPYRAQQMKIRERLSTWRDAPEVNSVDGFQGRENDVVVVSTVRCGGSLGFCDDERRINVLLTRAKRGLVVVGNRTTLELSPCWSKWLKEANAEDA